MIHPDDLRSCESPAIHFVDAAGARGLIAELTAAGIRVGQVDAALVSGKDDLLAAIARAVDAPYAGVTNWDALDEILRDLDWLAVPDQVVFVSHARRLWRDHYALAGTLVEVWLHAATHWQSSHVPFHLVFVDAGEG